MGLFKKKQPDAQPVPETSVSFQNEVVDATGAMGLRDDILETLKEHGIEPGSGQVVDASSIPGLSEQIMKELGQHGIQMPSFEGMTMVPGAAPVASDHVEQLAKLAEMHKKGALSDYEFAVAKEKLLGQNWDG